MTDYRTIFITWYYNKFRFDPLFTEMWKTVEGSPHHREQNVGVHTDMVVGQYLSRTSADTWSQKTVLGALAAAFHDVGKPIARERRWREDRGWYNKFAGHELVSARLWEDYAVQNWTDLVSLFDLIPDDLYAIGWMIERHLPYDIQKQDKFDSLVRTAQMAIDDLYGPEIFTTLLKSDAYGRISDDTNQSEGRISQVDQWTAKFLARATYVDPTPYVSTATRPSLILLVGPSGAGKSTAVRLYTDFVCQYYSLDQLRLDWYSDDYEEAFKQSCEDKQFNDKANKTYIEMVRDCASQNKNLIVDNTNGSRRKRRFYIQEARKKGFGVRIVIMPVAYNQLIERQTSRTDKTVPPEAVRRQFMSLNYPEYGEADTIDVRGHNLPDA